MSADIGHLYLSTEHCSDELEWGREYYWKRTEGWDWFGTQRWWEISIMIHGMHGGGGYGIVENWRWNGNPQVVRSQFRSPSLAESRTLGAEILTALKASEVR